ncbi:MAG: response regulator [Acidobacteriota bacterium]
MQVRTSTLIGQQRAKLLMVGDGAKITPALREAGFEIVIHMQDSGTMVTILRERPLLVLLDLEMPMLNAWVICSLIKKRSLLGPLSTIPVIIYSSLDEEELVKKAARYGAEGYIHKDSDLGYAIEKISQYLKSKSA